MALFQIDIVTDPGTSLRPDEPMYSGDLVALRSYDEELLRPALLFADRVCLTSFREDMLQLVNSEAFKVYGMPLRRVHQFLELSLHRPDHILSELGLTEADLATASDAALSLQQSGSESGLDALMAFERRYEGKIDNYVHAALGIWRRRYENLSLEIPQSLKEYLEVRPWSAGDDGSFDLAWTEGRERFFARGILSVLERMASSTGVTMLDSGADYQLQMSRLSKMALADVSAGEIAQEYVARLPGIQQLGLDEIADLRSDLRDALPAFRSEMVRLSRDINSDPEQPAASKRRLMEERWEMDIAPALEEIERNLKRASYPRRLLHTITEDRDAALAAVGSLAMGIGSLAAGIATLLPAVAGAAYPFVKAVNRSLEESDKVREHKLFWLYRVRDEARDRARR